ncbi:MAG: mannose-1-phosphate guanyltransferase, partial [Proteobacteria bacterium]
MNVMLLAAGEGTRLRPHTLIRPKPTIPFLNLPLAAYPLSLLEDMRVDRLVVNTFHLPTKVVDLFINLNHGARKLHFSHEINQIMGSGGGLG